MIGALVASLLIIAVGWPLASVADPTSTLGARLGEAYLLGAAASVVVLLFVPWSQGIVIGALLIVAIGGALAFRRYVRAGWRPPALIDAITLILVAGYARFATIAPTPEADFIGIWGLKAREFWVAHGIDWQFLENPLNAFAHPDYPPLVPLLFDVHAVIANAWIDRWLGVVNVAFGVATLLIVRAHLADEIATPWKRAIATLAFVPFALSPWIGLAECAMVAYGTAGLLLLRRATVRDALHGAIYLGFAANCKNEGLTLIAAAALALLVTNRRMLIHLWPAVALAAPWSVLRYVHHLRNDLVAGFHLGDVAQTLAALAQQAVGKPLFWFGIALAFVIAPRRLVRERFLIVAIVLQLLFFVAAYVVTPHDVIWHVRWSWERIVGQLTPLIVFLAIELIAPVLQQRDLAPAS